MFEFSLEPLLDHRRHREDRLQKAFATAQDALASAEHRRLQMQQKQQSLAKRMQNRQRGGVLVGENRLFGDALRALQDALERQETAIEALKQEKKKIQSQLIEAMKERKMLEKLKEREFREYCTQKKRRELQFMDEVAVHRFNRNHPSTQRR